MLNTAVELTGAGLERMEVSGTSDEQALQLRDARPLQTFRLEAERSEERMFGLSPKR